GVLLLGLLNAPLDVADGVGVFVEFCAVAGTEIAVEPRQAAVHVIEDAPLSLEHRQPRCGVGAIDVAEESLENRARIVLDWQRRGLAAPRDGVGVGAAIAAVAIAGELV